MDKPKINWLNTVFLLITPVLALLGSIYWFLSPHYNTNTLIFALIYLIIVELSITAGYHRLFSHRSFESSKIFELICLIFGAAAFQGSALAWALDHRNHHRYVDDSHRDPYSKYKTFWWRHIAWIFYKFDDQITDEILSTQGADLNKSLLVRFQHKFYVVIAVTIGLILPSLIAMQWSDFLGGFLIAGVSRIFINQHTIFLINSLSHSCGKATHSDAHSARDNLLVNILTLGEGYHNYHHEFPSDYRCGYKIYHWDPTKWLINLLSRIGLAKNLKRSELILSSQKSKNGQKY